MKYCCVPQCKSKAGKSTPFVHFFTIPTDISGGVVNPVKKRRREEWMKAINGTETDFKHARICSRHFVSGRPAPQGAVFNVDWVPNLHLPPKPNEIQDDFLVEIITNLPEINEEFDVPEYVTLDKYVFNETQIESELVKKCITNPVCDDKGYYRNDHDYLRMPLIYNYDKTDFEDHNYSTNEKPACLYADLKYFCNICQCNSINLFRFNRHMMSHTLRNDVTCSICGQQFLTTTCLNNHMALHTTICDICGNEVPIVQIGAHQEVIKQQKKVFGAQDEYKISQNEKVNFCIFCMREFGNKRDYLEHLSTHKVVRVTKTRGSPKVQVVKKNSN